MRISYWIDRFERNKKDRPEPNWAEPVTLRGPTLAKVLSSLEQFELGDGGGPASLIAYNARSFSGVTPEMQRLVDSWFAEEREHSRLLGCSVRRLGGKKIHSHWSFTAFCAVRRIIGVRFELQVLLLTEIVSTAYYRVLRRHVDDEAVRQMCCLILRDEAGHVSFHRDRLAAKFSRTPDVAWQAQFWGCGLAAATMLWVNHGPCLRAIGGSRAEYYQEVRLEIARFVRRLNSACLAQRSLKMPIQVTSMDAARA